MRLERAGIKSIEDDRRDSLEELEGIRSISDLLSLVAAFRVETRSKDNSGCSAVDLSTADS